MITSPNYMAMLDQDTPTAEENWVLIRKARRGDTDAAWELAMTNSKIVMRTISNMNLINDDAFSYGLNGFYEAALRLDDDDIPMARFFVYVSKYVFGYVRMGMKHVYTQVSGDGSLRSKMISKDRIYDENDFLDTDFDKHKNSEYHSDPFTILLKEDNNDFIKSLLDDFLDFDGNSDKLSDKQKIILRLLIQHEGNCAAVAKYLGESRESIRMRRFIIARKLRAFLFSRPDLMGEFNAELPAVKMRKYKSRPRKINKRNSEAESA